MGYAIEDGGQILCGEKANAVPIEVSSRVKDGYFFRPTVIVGLADDSRKAYNHCLTCVIFLSFLEFIIFIFNY
jgi:hypothetical protein